MTFKKQYSQDLPLLDINDNLQLPLKAFTLGRFSLLIEDKPLKFTGSKAQHKPLELLKALIVFGGRDISKYHLANTLYPEIEEDKACNALATTIHRLRKLLRKKDVVHFYDHKLALNSGNCWVDVWILERLLGRIDRALAQPDTDENEISYLTNKSLQLYRGEFLKGEIDIFWALSYRRRLRYKFLRKLSLLGQFWEQKGQMRIAMDIYIRALEEDELSEEFYQLLMICYQKQGFGGEAMIVYERCCRTLNNNLGIEPSAKTKAIRDQLI